MHALVFILLSFSVTVTSERASPVFPQTYHHSFLGEFDNGYTEEKYRSVLKIFLEIYQPIIQARGGEFRFISDWQDGAVNMWAWRWGDEYVLEVPGGFSRYHLINEEAFVVSICHEMGHLMGGAPMKGETISLEGQADYFATLKCAKRMMARIDPFDRKAPEGEVEIWCEDKTHVSTSDCHRILQGALSLTSYYAKIEKSNFPKISTPDKNKVSKTTQIHPPAQCRLDTFVAGLRCPVSIETPTSTENPEQGVCNGDQEGARPRCWYRPI